MREYERLAPLAAARRALPSLRAARRGDCLVAFSRRDVHSIKRQVEAGARHSCCVVCPFPKPRSCSRQATKPNAADDFPVRPVPCCSWAHRGRRMLVWQVYGALPPESRAQQAVLFNTDRTGYNVLAASDAVGMGLNLNIRWAPTGPVTELPACQQSAPSASRAPV